MISLEAQQEVLAINLVVTSHTELLLHQVSLKATFIAGLRTLMTSNKDFFKLIKDRIRAFKKLTGIVK